MAKSSVLTTLLLLAITAVARTQYFDLLQDLQQLFLPYQPQRQNFGHITRPTDRHANKQNRTKTGNEQRKIKKPPTNPFDYLFATTVKPNRKTTKASNKVNNNYNNEYVYLQSTTNKSNRHKTTTRVQNSNKSITRHRTTTDVNVNRAVSGSTNEKNEKYTIYKDVNNNFTNFNRANKITSNHNINREDNNDTSWTIVFPEDNSRVIGSDYTTVSNKRNKVNNTNQNINTAKNNNWANNREITTNDKNNKAVPTDHTTNFDGGNQVFNKYIINTGTTRGIVSNNENRGFETAAGNVNVGNLNNPPSSSEHNNRRLIGDNFGFTTQNPLLNRPGVIQTDVDHGRPPITNRPDSDKIYFPDSEGFLTSDTPELLIGPDEDDMTSLQKRRYADLAEKMCDRYKGLSVKKVVALPLVPSPSPVEFNVTSCTPVSIPLVIGGKVVSIKEFPHMALIGWMKIRIAGYSWKCGGSLISEQYVLTAGHCTYQDKDYNVESGPPQAVQLGSTYLDDPGALVMKISSVIRHPKYKTRRSYHDIALIKMVHRVTFSEVIKPACLGAPPSAGNKVVATGWGRTEFGGDHSYELRSVSLPIWDIQQCQEVWGTSLKLPYGPAPDSHMCAGERKGGKDTCQGDSGGPAQIQDGCIWRVVAVTSYGRSCGAPQTPALYALIPKAFVAAQVFGDEVDYGGRGDANSNRRSEEYYRNR